MSDAEKLANYDRIVRIIDDQISLQKHLRAQEAAFDEIQFQQADSYSKIVDIVVGPDTLLLI